MRSSSQPLPIDHIIPGLKETFRNKQNVILSADPGAGKTTRVPPALLTESWLSGRKVIMLEPRRLAAQRAAAYIADSLGERVGETIGYRIRGESKIGGQTRLEIVTEGILTRLLQTDPALPGAGLVIFDEFHERSIHADLGLALTLDAQRHLRPDLRILVMSATLDGLSLQSLLDGAPILKSTGRAFPVTTHYLENPRPDDVGPLVVSTIRRALKEEGGDVLVFLPGQREIRRIESVLTGSESPDARSEERAELLPPGVTVHTLYGDAPPDRQQAALAPARAGERKIILSTNIAETSITIDGVRVVIDAGLARSARFDPRRGMSGLVTTRVSQAGADQRRGRAGREAPGTCYRLWTSRDHAALPMFTQPEIVLADLAPLALELARWGAPDGEGLRFLDPPPAAHLSQAREILRALGAIDHRKALTEHGRRLAELPVHPRVAHMLLRGKELGAGALACDVAALLEEPDILRGAQERDVDLHSRWRALRSRNTNRRAAPGRIREQADRLRRMIRATDGENGEEKLGILLALAYPERVAKRRHAERERFQLAGGVGATLPKGSALHREEYLAVGDVDGVGNEVRILLAEPLTETEIRDAFAGQLTTEEYVGWDPRQECVVARKTTRFGAIELSGVAFVPESDVSRSHLISGIREMGLQVLPWTDHARSIQARSEWLRTTGGEEEGWPDISDERLLVTLEEWLGPYLDGMSRRAHLAKLDLSRIIGALFSYDRLRQLDRLAPTHLTVPTGSRIPVGYTVGSPPVLAVRLQEMFGQTETPTVCAGRVRVVLHLLSPARRPLAVTQDLPSFWKNAYPEVRKDMRGKYPKHSWPENPLEAEPTRRTKRSHRV